MKQQLVAFLYRDNVRSAAQVGAFLFIGLSILFVIRFFIIAYWAAFYPI